MTERFSAEVVHVVGPGELDDHDLEPALRSLAESRYVLVCRKGGRPSLLGRVTAALTGAPIETVTVVSDDPATAGEELDLAVEETDLPGVYDAVERR